ncbi:histidine kinase [Faecalicatena sp. AGMB00832]|uniref:Histidine kinase n=1 Tax=Faecalicatena faecalis TaxID=2726362 RepID=A0ABS6D7A5_9FIRM|nr:sensor histidine kinase [Faecalicatena faecalis]MBU3877489.1 histidine kinase [Faecalicatena faecalis]
MNKRRAPLKLKTILIILTACIITCTLGISGIISFQMFEKLMVQKISNSRVDVLSQISEKVSTIKSNAEMLSNLYFYNENLTEIYHDGSFTEEEKKQIQDHFNNIEKMTGMTQAATGLEFYYTFLMENGYVYTSDPKTRMQSLADYRNKLWFLDVMEEKEKWISTYEDIQGRSVISIARTMKDKDGKFIGLFLFNIYEHNFSQVFEALSGQNDIYIVDHDGNIVSHKNKELIGIRFYDMDVMNQMFQHENYSIIEKSQKKYLFSIFKNQELDWMIVEEIPLELLLGDVQSIGRRMVLIGLVIFAVSMLVCLYISQRTARPLKELVYELEKVGRSEKNEQTFEVSGWREINTICEECNYMNQRIRGLVTAIKESEKKKRAAEMGFMQSQMSPHFLYNTLFSIRCLVDMGNKEGAIGIIDAFTSILKYILSYKSEFVDVAQEIKFLEDYSVLQKYRYGDQFSLEIECPSELYQKKVLRMILEPLVENSLFHGLDDEVERIHVTVSFKIEAGDMIITVTDDGVGFTDENFMKLSRKIRSGEQSNMIGMNNIRERLKMTFGKKYGLSIDTNYEEGARIFVKMPVID